MQIREEPVGRDTWPVDEDWATDALEEESALLEAPDEDEEPGEELPGRESSDDWPQAAAPRQKAKPRRLRAYWGVFSESLKQVALFDYAQPDEARRRAAELTDTKRVPHFVRVVKQEIAGS